MKEKIKYETIWTTFDGNIELSSDAIIIGERFLLNGNYPLTSIQAQMFTAAKTVYKQSHEETAALKMVKPYGIFCDLADLKYGELCRQLEVLVPVRAAVKK